MQESEGMMKFMIQKHLGKGEKIENIAYLLNKEEKEGKRESNKNIPGRKKSTH